MKNTLELTLPEVNYLIKKYMLRCIFLIQSSGSSVPGLGQGRGVPPCCFSKPKILKEQTMKKHYVAKTIDVGKIVVDPFNPPRRIANKSKLYELSADIKRNGLLDEIKVRMPFKGERKGYYYVFDGHRRLKAMKMLKATKIDCFVYTLEDKEEAERVYNSINSTSMKMSSAQYAYRWLMGCTIPKKHMNDIELLAGWFGGKKETFRQQVRNYCIGNTSPRQHVLTTQAYLDYFFRKNKKAKLIPRTYDVPTPKDILKTSFKDSTFRTWKSSLWGRSAERPINPDQIIERINDAK